MPLPCGNHGSYNCQDAEGDGSYGLGGNGRCGRRGSDAKIGGEARERCHQVSPEDQ